MNNSLKKTAQTAIIFAIGAAFLYFVFKGTNWPDLWQKFIQANFNWIAVGLAISLISHWLRAYRATMLYQAMDYKISTANSLHAVFIGYFINYFIPRGGEVSRCAALTKTNQLPIEKGLGSVIVERLVDMLMLVVIIGLVFLLQFNVIYDYITTNLGANKTAESNNLKYYLIGATFLVGVMLWLMRKKLVALSLFIKLLDKVKGFAQGFASIKQVQKPVLFMVLSAGIWLCYILMMYFCLFALTATASLTFTQCLTVFAMGTIGMIIPAPGAGAGTYHFAVMQGLLLFGVAQEDGIAYATIVHGAQMVMFIVIGAISSLVVLSKHKQQVK
ncbi:MAG: flippase-like domain-containing protein [Bacteroidia bacterium]|nr:flippase-like domain-containing protein [Bacteroidia bacterium]